MWDFNKGVAKLGQTSSKVGQYMKMGNIRPSYNKYGVIEIDTMEI